MKGTMLVIGTDRKITRSDVSGAMDETMVATVQKEIGGWLELVPYFNSIRYDGEVRRCVAFCNDEGKLDGLPHNPLADQLHADAMKRDYGAARSDDYLVGNIVIFYGDREFMESL